MICALFKARGKMVTLHLGNPQLVFQDSNELSILQTNYGIVGLLVGLVKQIGKLAHLFFLLFPNQAQYLINLLFGVDPNIHLLILTQPTLLHPLSRVSPAPSLTFSTHCTKKTKTITTTTSRPFGNILPVNRHKSRRVNRKTNQFFDELQKLSNKITA